MDMMNDEMSNNGNEMMDEGLSAAAMGVSMANIDMLMDVPLFITVELGRTKMLLQQALELQSGSVIELDRIAGDPIDVFINDRLIARGEVVVVDDKFAVRITELVTSKPKSE